MSHKPFTMSWLKAILHMGRLSLVIVIALIVALSSAIGGRLALSSNVPPKCFPNLPGLGMKLVVAAPCSLVGVGSPDGRIPGHACCLGNSLRVRDLDAVGHGERSCCNLLVVDIGRVAADRSHPVPDLCCHSHLFHVLYNVADYSHCYWLHYCTHCCCIVVAASSAGVVDLPGDVASFGSQIEYGRNVGNNDIAVFYVLDCYHCR